MRLPRWAEAAYHDGLVYKLRLAHGLRDFIPAMHAGVKQRGVVGRHFTLPSLHAQLFIQGGFQLANLIPPPGVIRMIAHHSVENQPDQQPHDKMIGKGSKVMASVSHMLPAVWAYRMAKAIVPAEKKAASSFNIVAMFASPRQN